MVPGSYQNGFAPRDGLPLYPELWRGCVGAWAPCLGPSGLTLRDWSGYGNHGTLTNMAAGDDWVGSQGRYALDLDGTNDYVQLSNAPFVATQILWSFSGWFYFRTLAGSDSDPCLLNSGSAYLAVGSSSRMQFFNSAWRSYTGTVPAGRWTHLAWVRRAVSACEAYLDGASLGSLAFNPGELTSSTQLGSRVDASTLGLDGFMDSLHLHNRPLSANEIRILASRRGIAYDLAPRRRSMIFTGGSGFKAYWATRKAQIIGGGL